MTSVVSICNLGLANIGKQRIDSLDEPTAEARASRQFYEIVRDTVLQSYPWSCAGKTIALAQIVNDQPGKWVYAYKRPSDCLKIRWLRPLYSASEPCPLTDHQEMMIPYDVIGDTFYCNLSPAYLRYTSRLTDPTKFPPLLVDTIGWHLSVRFAMPLTKDPKVRADAYQFAMQTQSMAEIADANEVRETSDHDSELVEVRQ